MLKYLLAPLLVNPRISDITVLAVDVCTFIALAGVWILLAS
jgi:hypothetical protein